MTENQNLATTRFGTVAFEPEDVIEFPDGLLGFQACRRFVVLNHQDESPFRWLQSLDDPGVAFLVTDPFNFVANYTPEMEPLDAERLGLTEEMPRLVYTIVTIPSGRPQEMTLNLAGPIVVNVLGRIARQVVVEDEKYGIRHRLIPDSSEADAA